MEFELQDRIIRKIRNGGVYMKRKLNLGLGNTAVVIYAITALLFIIFAAFMVAVKDNTVYSARDIASYKTVENCTENEIADSSAPVGVRKEYTWQIGEIENNESCLMFYVVHSYAEVRLDGELIYSLTVDENTKTGHSPSGNWIVVPFYPSDVGKTVTVTVTPVYQSVQNRKVDFKIGSRYAFFMRRLAIDLPQIILSCLCILMGILLIVVQICFIVKKRTSSAGMLYLGVFSLLLGIWRITDTRFSPIIFANSAAALGYVTLSTLSIMAVPLLLFINEQYAGRFRRLLPCLAVVNCTVALVVLLCQVTDLAELRETLVACHIMLIVDIAAVAFVFLVTICREAQRKSTVFFFLLLIAGTVVDLIYYYSNNTSSGMMSVTIAFLVYIVYLFTENVLNIHKKAYVDDKTQLYNKARWEEFIREDIPDNEPIGVMMLDLNRLKHANDTYGHKAGDRIIVKFSEILRDTFDSSDFLCRWGGDEFVVIVRNADFEKLEHDKSAVRKATEEYNCSGAKPEIHFACGYVLSTEFPNVSRNELLTKADERMYSDKQEWYEKLHIHSQNARHFRRKSLQSK